VLDLLYRNELNFLNHLSELNHFPLGINATWRTAQNVNVPNTTLADWLLHTGSLTERLQSLTSRFSVEVIGQATLEADKSEQLALPNYHSQNWQIREVILYGDDKPWVFARSILPEHLCNTTWATLGSQPLGQRIFNDDQFVRSEFLIAELGYNPLTKLSRTSGEEPSSAYKEPSSCGKEPSSAYEKPSSLNDNIWARRSRFQIQEWQLLVAEVFLPDCPCYRD
jgi:chorismate--pyruvate lyase